MKISYVITSNHAIFNLSADLFCFFFLRNIKQETRDAEDTEIMHNLENLEHTVAP